ncbi:Catechol 2,3-dioxygenase [Paenibacillus sp. 1_12]|uniref:VOC family protein n=1 Tax=Paenibacillus sp. 1_12 TaxID=1566278 RepID=UPI0008F1AC57|nr:VOC family protein [Paenibacillus sp. 1_12]SFK79841.1 Catechol 2,3-dioxygenase [Paenibacillus sp. 1_12]
MIVFEGIHHVSLVVRDLERSKAFYTEILGLKEMDRPPFDFEGAWFAIAGGSQQLHLIVHEGQTLRDGNIDSRDGHFALRVSSYEHTRKWLEEKGIHCDLRPHAKAGFPQIYVLDPDCNIIELNAEVYDG